jgi:hypothetical protein
MKERRREPAGEQDAAESCHESDSPALIVGGKSVGEGEGRKLDPDEIPLPPIAQKDGRMIALRCRTLQEACLVCEELEKEDILAVIGDEEELRSQIRRSGYVEVRVTANAYESLPDLRSAVEFQYKQVRAERRLAIAGKVAGLFCGALILLWPVFFWQFFSYRENGYDRMAREFRLWFFLGAVTWVLFVVGMSLFG